MRIRKERRTAHPRDEVLSRAIPGVTFNRCAGFTVFLYV
jgi:hypothetical protein